MASPGVAAITIAGETERRQVAYSHASLIRVTTLLVWLIILLGTPFEALHVLDSWPHESYGIGRILLANQHVRRLLFSPQLLEVLRVVGVLSCLLALLAPRSARWSTIVLFGAVVTLDACSKAVGGFANHAQAAALLLLGLFTLTWKHDYVELLSIFARRRRSHADQQTEAGVEFVAKLILILPYTYIGANRLLTGRTDIFQSDAILVYLGVSSAGFAAYGGWLDPLAIRSVLKAGFLTTTLFEFASPLVLLSNRFRVCWLIAITGFHLSTLLLMNIFFWENAALCLAVFGWGRLGRRTD